MNIITLSPARWVDYELIDCGDLEKLERFGPYCLVRPEPQAIWRKRLPDAEWKKLAHARFRRNPQKVSNRAARGENGDWEFYHDVPQSWVITYPLAAGTIRIKVAPTSFGHVGAFPEQAVNWDYIVAALKGIKDPKPQVLNLFAYTGGASLAAAAAGAEVTHLDAVKQVVTWARGNMELSGLQGIKWLVEDALKYLRREARRNRTYHGIILDPPAYGRGPKGEKWILKDCLVELLELCAQRLESRNSFVVLNLYSLGFSPLVALNFAQIFEPFADAEAGELHVESRSGTKLPLGTVLRLRK